MIRAALELVAVALFVASVTLWVAIAAYLL